MKKRLISNILKTSFLNKEGHVASSLSILDILMTLYFNHLKDDDEFILSKGHASLGLYSIFLEKGYISEDDLFSFCQFNSKLGGHPSSHKLEQIKISTGSLGHGLAFSVGLALGKKIKNESGNVYCLIGDGESNEGSIWESALLAGSLGLDNLTCIMDFNRSGERAVKLSTCLDKFKSFNWEIFNVDGHNQQQIKSALDKKCNLPKFIEADTIKGKGCLIMENNPEWHHKSPYSVNELEQMLADINI